MALKTSFVAETTYREVYTGGAICYEPLTGCLICPSSKGINFLNPNSGLVQHTIEGDDSGITAVACSTNGKLALALESNQILIFQKETDSDSWLKLSQVKCKTVQSLSWDYSGAMVAASSSDGTVKVFNAKGGFCTHNFVGHSGVVHLCWFYPLKGALILFSAGQDTDIRQWDLVQKKCTAVLSSHYSVVTSFALANKSTLVTGGRDKVLSVWNLTTGTLTKAITAFEEVESLVRLPKGAATKEDPYDHIVSGGWRGILRVWDIAQGTEIFTQKETLSKSQQGGELKNEFIETILPCGDSLVVVTNEQNIFVNEPVAPFTTKKTIIGWNDEILDLAFINTSKGIGSDLVIAANSPSLRSLSVKTNSWQIFKGHTDIILKVVASRDYEWLATSSKDGEVRLWSVIDNEAGLSLVHAAIGQGHLAAVSSLAWSQRGSHFLISGSADMTLKLWDLKPLKKWKKSNPEPLERTPISIAPFCALKAHEKEINCVRLSPDDMLVATASQDKLIRLWERTDQPPYLKLRSTLTGHRRAVWHVAFSPVDKVLVSGSADGTIKIWSLTDNSCLRTLEGHSGSVLAVEFLLPAALQIISTGVDGLVKLWNIKENECVASFENHEAKVWGASFIADGTSNRFATGGSDSKIIIWKDNTTDVKDQKRQQQQAQTLASQQLSNLVRHRKYAEAVKLAFKLKQPRQLLYIFEQVIAQSNPADLVPFENAPSNGSKALLHQIVLSLDVDEISQCLLWIRDWNTNNKTYEIAQQVLVFIFFCFNITSLVEVPQIKQALQGLLPYTQRHIARVDNFIQQSYIVDYTLAEMQMHSIDLGDHLEVEMETSEVKLFTETKKRTKTQQENQQPLLLEQPKKKTKHSS